MRELQAAARGQADGVLACGTPWMVQLALDDAAGTANPNPMNSRVTLDTCNSCWDLRVAACSAQLFNSL
jgi:hypothetical protein